MSKPNAERLTISDVMSDPNYLMDTLAVRREMEAHKTAMKEAMGVKNPQRPVHPLDHVGFAEGVTSSNTNKTPVVPLTTNPRFTRR